MKVVVCHPSRQHSHRLAESLYVGHHLEAYVSGIPSGKIGRRMLGIWRAHWKNDAPTIPSEVSIWRPHATLLLAMSNRLLPDAGVKAIEYYAFGAFDRSAARVLRALSPNVVVGYECASEAVFTEARRIGAITVLDAASVHHRMQDRYFKFAESPQMHRRFIARKDAEIALADHIVTCSTFARDSYVEAGVPGDKISIVPLGVDAAIFHDRSRLRATDRSFRFVYVGQLSAHKGLDLLITAFEELRKSRPEIELDIVGPSGNLAHLVNARERPGVKYWGRLSQAACADILRRADCFILPSRVDSFGMVVAEAMSCGLPVIVSSGVGAKDMVEHGRNGWIFDSESIPGLISFMRIAVQRRDGLEEMGARGAQAVAALSWSRYQQAAGNLLSTLIERRNKAVEK